MSEEIDKVTFDKMKKAMWKCDVCEKDITHVDDDGDISSEIHFNISRSLKSLYFDEHTEVIGSGDLEYSIEEDLDNRNEKMLRMVCETCFNRIISESKTLRSMFECHIDGCLRILY